MGKDYIRLNEEVSPKEILNYFEEKYETKAIVTPKTIYNWLKELNIECIQPKPKRNKDIRYKKSDVLKLEKAKENRLRDLQYKYKQKSEFEQRAQIEIDKEQEYNSHRTYEKIEEDTIPSIDSYKGLAEQIIKDDMLRMCFKELFPNIEFDSQKLTKNLAIRSLRNIVDFSREEIGEAIEYIENKIYIKNKK
ncbi:hypothetical protein [Senegalia massiliensis]|uniref:hypothetical protein n=1 Tax=Senegalia massiliensis TaxID=1720316 RepID=UPI00102FD577|nr:hypothetical protein [Senegalia massiliensis]